MGRCRGLLKIHLPDGLAVPVLYEQLGHLFAAYLLKQLLHGCLVKAAYGNCPGRSKNIQLLHIDQIVRIVKSKIAGFEQALAPRHIQQMLGDEIGRQLQFSLQIVFVLRNGKPPAGRHHQIFLRIEHCDIPQSAVEAAQSGEIDRNILFFHRAELIFKNLALRSELLHPNGILQHVAHFAAHFPNIVQDVPHLLALG